jgi:hypothetical protein
MAEPAFPAGYVYFDPHIRLIKPSALGVFMVSKPASRLLQSKGVPEKVGRSNSAIAPVSAAAIRLVAQMQEAGFAGRVEKFMSMSGKEVGEAARKAAAVRKAPG